jgi:ATP-dependent Zn protease
VICRFTAQREWEAALACEGREIVELRVPYMSRIDQLSRLFKAVATQDFASAQELAGEIAASEERNGHHTAAQLLKGSLVPNGRYGAKEQTKNGFPSFLTAALSRRPTPVKLADVRLPRTTREQLADMITEVRHESRLRKAGLRPRTKLLFHGPPGCGKSLTAHAVAHELGLSLYVVRFDAIIGSYLGQTATHLRQLFQFAEVQDCVLLFDEIDALGKRRGSPTDVGELDRIVIALMQELELSETRGLVIATSNRPSSLDPALWRRFDLALRFPPPGRAEIKEFTEIKAGHFSIPLSRILLRRVLESKSYAEVERVVESAARRHILKRP